MLVKTYLEVGVDYELLRRTVDGPTGGWLAGLGPAFGRDADELLAQVGLRAPAADGQAMRVVLGEPLHATRVTSVPIVLDGGPAGRMISALDGSLDAAWLGPACTQLALSLHYEPPPSLVDRGLDRALLHRVIEVVAHRALVDVAARVEADLGKRTARRYPPVPGASSTDRA